MLRVNPTFTIEEGLPKRSSRLVLPLALMVACSLLSTGCNTMPQSSAPSSQASAQSAQPISIQTTLPNTGVGTGYHAVLSVSGGAAPYHFSVGSGALPPGLVLNPQTGSISGTPTQVGTFAFTIAVASMVASDPFGARLERRIFSVITCTCSGL